MGRPVSKVWIGSRMFQICKEDMPEGFDPSNINQFGKHWVHTYMDKKGLSIRRRTNKKKTSVFERMHKIQGFRWWSVYQMAFAPISSEEEESSDSDESNLSTSEDSSTESSEASS